MRAEGRGETLGTVKGPRVWRGKEAIAEATGKESLGHHPEWPSSLADFPQG